MKVQAVKQLKVKQGEKTIDIPEGAVVELGHESAEVLLREGKVRPMTMVFERLFHDHAQSMRQYVDTLDDIDKVLPARAEEIREIGKAMDTSWYREDLQGFLIAMKRLQALYGLVSTEMRGASPIACSSHTPPRGDCTGADMKLYPMTRDLQPWCRKHRNWCVDAPMERERRERYAKETTEGRYSS